MESNAEPADAAGRPFRPRSHRHAPGTPAVQPPDRARAGWARSCGWRPPAERSPV